jgi:16S rRNA (cytosine967-C5)-methyltransferase
VAAADPRAVALRVLERVGDGAYASLALEGEAARARLTSPDRRLATALVYGVLKGRARLDHALAAYAPRGLGGVDARTLDALRMGALQLLDLRVPAHAAVDQAVRLVRARRGAKLAGFANALLRRLAREGAPPVPAAPPARRLAVLSGAPEAIAEGLLARLGPVEAEALLLSEARPAPLWLRVNPRRAPSAEAVAAELSATGAEVTPSSLLPSALAVRGADVLFDQPAFIEGRVSLQDLGAQLVGALVDARAGEHVLDACAGVGGKSTQLAERMDDRGRVDAADLSARKLAIGQDHARRLGLGIVRAVEADVASAGDRLLPAYDRVLLDAPCSGLGVARRHPEVRLRPAGDRAPLLALQARLLDAVAARVRPGGVLVYSVCTYTDEEGPRQLAAFLERHPSFVRDAEAPIPESLRDRGAMGELRTWPHRDDADAFFAARLKRLG